MRVPADPTQLGVVGVCGTGMRCGERMCIVLSSGILTFKFHQLIGPSFLSVSWTKLKFAFLLCADGGGVCPAPRELFDSLNRLLSLREELRAEWDPCFLSVDIGGKLSTEIRKPIADAERGRFENDSDSTSSRGVV